MSIQGEIQNGIDQAIKNLEITIRIDDDNDLEVNLHYEGSEISSDFVSMDKIHLALKEWADED